MYVIDQGEQAKMIYFDNSATTKPYKEVLDTFLTVSEKYFGNPSSLHSLGLSSEKVLDKSREIVADLLQVEPKEIIFTSGGTEGNNLAIQGIAYKHRQRGNHLITSSIEHSATYETMKRLENEGFEVTYLPVDDKGIVSVEELKKAIRYDTILVSLIHVNNETGSIQPIEEIGEILKNHPKIFYHVDHVQGITKVPLQLKKANIDLCTISGHKFHGLKGTGALYVRSGIRLNPILLGGSQESRFRAGTENVAGAASLAKALKISMEKSESGIKHLTHLRNTLMNELEKVEGVIINTPKDDAAPHIINFSLPNMKPEVVIQALSQKEIYVSTKSACSSKLNEPSRILLEMGLGKTRAASAIRISFHFGNTLEEVAVFLQELKKIVLQLKEVMR